VAFGFDLSVIAIVGILLLIGIVKKNGIMMIDFAIHAEREQGLTPEQSIYQACIKRFRPILMTTMAAMLGAVPLMIGTGTGSEIREPLGYAIVGALRLGHVRRFGPSHFFAALSHPPRLPLPQSLDQTTASAVAKHVQSVFRATPGRVKQRPGAIRRPFGAPQAAGVSTLALAPIATAKAGRVLIAACQRSSSE